MEKTFRVAIHPETEEIYIRTGGYWMEHYDFFNHGGRAYTSEELFGGKPETTQILTEKQIWAIP